jgi:predicted phage tail protein
MNKILDPRIFGSGGGGGGGGKGKGDSGEEAPNTLRSKSTARIVDMLGEGEIQGLVNGEKSIFFNDVPVLSDDGSYNWHGVSWALRTGLPDQDVLPYLTGIESETVISSEVKKHAPVVYEVTNTEADSVRVTIRVPALFTQDDKGKLQANSVTFRIEVKAYGGLWVNYFGDLTISGKCTSTYDRCYSFPLPKNNTGVSYPWQVRVTRLTNDANDSNDNGIPDDQEDDTNTGNQNAMTFYSVVTIIEDKLSFPDSALIGLLVDAQLFGSNLPSRSYEVFGRIVQIPSNYDPHTRVYTGIWDGTFKWAWTNNPAWVFYDVCTNERFGLGEFISAPQVDKWALYEVAKYCDEQVNDGFGGFEPRLTFNGSISSQKEAFEFLQLMSSAFRGMTYWSSGAVTVSQDRPKDPIMLVTPANVIKGSFDYKSSALKSRHTAIAVTWNDPADLYKPSVEVVEDPDFIDRFGYRLKEVTAIGCTSRGQARRLGLWILTTELLETQTVTYQAGFDHAFLRPGDIIAIADPAIAGAEMGGRLLDGSTRGTVVLDRPVTFNAAKSYTLSVLMPDGTISDAAVPPGTSGDKSSVTLAQNLSDTPVPGAMWVLAASDLAPQTFKVVGLRETEDQTIEVVAMSHYEPKFAKVDFDEDIPVTPTSSIPVGPLVKPTGLIVTERLYKANNQVKTQVNVSWTNSTDPRIATYRVDYQSTSGGPWVVIGSTEGQSIDDMDFTPGTFVFRVSALAYNGGFVQIQTTQQIFGKSAPPSVVQNLGASPSTDGVLLYWDAVPDIDTTGYIIREGSTWDTGVTINALVVTTSFFVPLEDGGVHRYMVRAIDESGNLSKAPAYVSAQVTVPADVTSFRAQPQGDNMTFRWVTVSGSGIEYEIRRGDTWNSGVFVARSAGDNCTVLLPGKGSSNFCIKARSKAGLYSTSALFAGAALMPPPRNVVFTQDQLALVWPGVWHNMRVNALADNQLEAISGAVPATYLFTADLGANYRARTTLELVVGGAAIDDGGITFDAATYTFDDEQAKQSFSPRTDVLSTDLSTKIAVFQGYAFAADLLDGVLFDQTVTSLRGAAPSVQPGAPAYAQAVSTMGLSVDETKLVTYPIAFQPTFTYTCRLRLQSRPVDPIVFFTLWRSTKTVWYRCGYDPTTGTLYVQKHTGAKISIVLPDLCIGEYGFTVGVGQSDTTLFVVVKATNGDPLSAQVASPSVAAALEYVSLFGAC